MQTYVKRFVEPGKRRFDEMYVLVEVRDDLDIEDAFVGSVRLSWESNNGSSYVREPAPLELVRLAAQAAGLTQEVPWVLFTEVPSPEEELEGMTAAVGDQTNIYHY